MEHALEAHHAPDLFPVQHELVKAVSGPLATQERAAYKALSEARDQLEQGQAHQHSAGDEPAQRGPGRPPKAPVRLEHAAPARAAASRAQERLAQHREHVAKSIRRSGHASHLVDLERGGRRNGPRIAAAMQAHSEQVRAMAQQEGLRQSCVERLENAERGVPKRQATIAFVAGYVRQQVAQRDVTPPASCALHAKLIPAYDLERVAPTRTVREGEPLRELAERRRAPWCAPGGVFSALRPEAHDQLHDEAKRLAAVFQRSRATVEGRNGSLSLRHPQLRGRDLPRTREGFTAMHHFFLTRPDGTTAAERFFGQKPRSMFAAIVDAGELAPAPLRPPRKA